MNNVKTTNIKNLKAVILDDSANIEVTSRDCVFELFIEYKNGDVEIVSVENLSKLEERRELTKLFGQCLNDSSLNKNIVNGMIQDSDNVQLYKISDTKKLEEYDAAVGELEEEKRNLRS